MSGLLEPLGQDRLGGLTGPDFSRPGALREKYLVAQPVPVGLAVYRVMEARGRASGLHVDTATVASRIHLIAVLPVILLLRPPSTPVNSCRLCNYCMVCMCVRTYNSPVVCGLCVGSVCCCPRFRFQLFSSFVV